MDVVERFHVLVQLLVHQRGLVGVSDDFNVSGAVGLLSCLKCVIEHAAAVHTGIESPLAAQGVRKLGVVSHRNVVVGQGHVLAQQPLAEIPRVVEHKDDRVRPVPTELADLLSGHLVRTFAVIRISRRSGAPIAAPKAAGVAQPIDAQRVWL